MARRLVFIPVLPKVTVSVAENFPAEGSAAIASRMVLEVSSFVENHAAPMPVAERMRNSRRCIGTSWVQRLPAAHFLLGYTRDEAAVAGFLLPAKKILSRRSTGDFTEVPR